MGNRHDYWSATSSLSSTTTSLSHGSTAHISQSVAPSHYLATWPSINSTNNKIAPPCSRQHDTITSQNNSRHTLIDYRIKCVFININLHWKLSVNVNWAHIWRYETRVPPPRSAESYWAAADADGEKNDRARAGGRITHRAALRNKS